MRKGDLERAMMKADVLGASPHEISNLHVVMCMAWPEALSQAKPSQSPLQANSEGLAWDFGKPKPWAWSGLQRILLQIC